MTYDPSCEFFRINKQLCKFSPDGRFLALANQSSLIVKNTGTFDDYMTFDFPDDIESMKWSSNSEFILCYNLKKAVIQIFSVSYPEYKFKLTEGSAGLDSVIWAPNCKHIITIADLKVQLSAWSLVDNTVMHIKNLKSSALQGIKFSPNGKYLALIVIENGQDSIDLYKTKDWKLSKKLVCDGLNSIDGICWSPNNQILGIWCAISGSAKIIIYSMTDEKYEGIFEPNDNLQISSGQFDEELRGLEIVKWMPSSQLIAVSGHNETIVLINCLTGKSLLQLRLEPVIKGDNYLVRIFKECSIKLRKEQGNKKASKTSLPNDKHILEEVSSRPFNIPLVKSETLIGGDPASVVIRVIDILEFSACGQFLAARHQIYPGTVWIWDLKTNGLDVLILQNSISAIKWDPMFARLLIFTESTNMFEWNPNEVSCLDTPRSMTVIDACWHPFSNVVALRGYNRAAIYRFNPAKSKLSR